MAEYYGKCLAIALLDGNVTVKTDYDIKDDILLLQFDYLFLICLNNKIAQYQAFLVYIVPLLGKGLPPFFQFSLSLAAKNQSGRCTPHIQFVTPVSC